MNRMLRGLVVLSVLFAAGAALSGQLSPVLPLDTTTGSSIAALPRLMDTTDQDASAAVQQVIQQSNAEQVQAIASHDSSVMSDTVTSDHYQELVKVNQALVDSGVSSIN